METLTVDHELLATSYGHCWVSHLLTDITVDEYKHVPSCNLSSDKYGKRIKPRAELENKGKHCCSQRGTWNLAIGYTYTFSHYIFGRLTWLSEGRFPKTAPVTGLIISVIAGRAPLVNRTEDWNYLHSRRTTANVYSQFSLFSIFSLLTQQTRTLQFLA